MPLLALCVALPGGVASAAAVAAEPGAPPAPPPGSYCRVSPPAGWPSIGTGPVPDLTPFQDYRAGLRIDAGLDASGIRIADVEYEWGSGHVDLAARRLPAAAASGLDAAFRTRDHGTAVLGILGAADDGRGITGLASGATLLPVSPIFSDPFLPYQPVRAIAQAVDGLRAGDVLLIELQALVVREDHAPLLGPIEFYPTVREVIARAVEKGIVVVEPAGNGGLDVGTLGQPWLSDASDPLATGALVVGAGGSGLGDPPVADLERVPGSNFGARVDVQGYGAAVVTTGYSDISPGAAGTDRSYTACFDGTSSASATVAGAAAVLQSAAIARTGAPMTPAALRDLLVDTGLPQVPSPGDENAGTQNIGPRPQIAVALASLTSQPPPPAVPGPVAPATPVTTPGSAVTPAPAPFAPGATSASAAPTKAVVAKAVRGLSTRFDRASRRLVVHLRGAVSSATVSVGGRRVRLDHGRLVLRNVAPGRFVLRVSATPKGGARYREVAFRITVPVRGAVRVTRI